VRDHAHQPVGGGMQDEPHLIGERGTVSSPGESSPDRAIEF
jgi:hypothetical protein